jgi:hypothetical protein
MRATAALSAAILCHTAGAAEESALAKMPVKEVTVFKDGHALLVHEGAMPVDPDGSVRLDYVPSPVLGTFWPYASQNGVKLSAVTSSPRRVSLRKTALTIKEIIEANTGAACGITETTGKKYTATIVGIPVRNPDELQRNSPPGSGDLLAVKADVVLLKTSAGTQAVPLSKIQDVTIAGGYKSQTSEEEMRNLLTFKLDWAGQKTATARIGMMYLQNGLRWIPSYKVEIDGKGHAQLWLQATLSNEITDLSDVTMNLVIGVPSFFFKDSQDPIGLQQAIAPVSAYLANNSYTNLAMSNGLMGQMGGFGGGGGGFGRAAGAAAMPAPNPEVGSSEKNEDLFLFTVKHVSLKKGQRMTLPITHFGLEYRDLYTVDMPITPPREARTIGNLNEQQLEMVRLESMPKAEHKIRLMNKSAYPLTTAPALIISNGHVLAQAQMTYTSQGAETDLKLTTAVGIKVKKKDQEEQRTPNAANFQGTQYGKVDMEGVVTLTSFQDKAIDIEVRRSVLAATVVAADDGKAEMMNTAEDDDLEPVVVQNPAWWGWYSWPWWWYHFNGLGKVTWSKHIEPGKSVELHYKWSYYWQ